MSGKLSVVEFGGKRNARQTLLQAGTDDDVLHVVVIKVLRPAKGTDESQVQTSWSDGLSKLEVLGLTTVAAGQVREWQRG